MIDNYTAICDILRKDNRFVSSEGTLLKNKVIECSNKMDADLLSLLYENPLTKDMFFTDVKGMQVFDKVKFGWIVDSEDFLPDSYTRFKNSIVLSDTNGNAIKKANEVVLEFPHKDCILEMDSTSEDEDRKEVFLNETIMKNDIDCLLAPKCFVNPIRHSEKGSVATTELDYSDNLIIKGNNLLALYSLLPRYKGQIKLMYWDILYNTQNDKVPYNDSFKHSSWLVMMKNRLEIARHLLKENGVICLQCDDNEQAYLQVLCDEIFGRENRINTISVNMSNMSGQKVNNAINGKRFPKLKEYILIYAKEKQNVILTIPKIAKDSWDKEYNKIIPEWTMKDFELFDTDIINANNILKSYSLMSLEEYAKRNKIDLTDAWKWENAYRIFATKPNSALLKIAKECNFDHSIAFVKNASQDNKLIITEFNKETSTARLELVSAYKNQSVYLGDSWTDIVTVGGVAQEGNVVLQNGKKPEKLINRIIHSCSNENDIVLDAYLGSGTTAAVCHKVGRRYIGIEQLNSHFDMAITRLKGVINGDTTGISKSVNWLGGGSFVSCELAENSQYLINIINNSDSDKELEDIYEQLKVSSFVLYRVDINKMEENKDAFKELSIEDKKKFLVSIIDKNTLYVNYSDIDDINTNIKIEDKEFTKVFYEGGE